MTLNGVQRGISALICGFDPCPSRSEMVMALRETGFAEGDEVEILARGPFGIGPFSVRLGRRLIGLRSEEAACIQVDDFGV